MVRKVLGKVVIPLDVPYEHYRYFLPIGFRGASIFFMGTHHGNPVTTNPPDEVSSILNVFGHKWWSNPYEPK